MTEYIQIIILGIIQGITEFLPISSSGHLQLTAFFFNWRPEESALMSIVLHAGTLLAIILYYWKVLLGILKRKDYILVLKLFIATLPVVFLGFIYKKCGLDNLIAAQPVIPGLCFIVTALILFFSRKDTNNTLELKELSSTRALLIGIAQSVAILPGISRSGSTIGTALKLGLTREEAAKFSFLLAIPAIGGAVFYELVSQLKAPAQELANAWFYTTGFLVSFTVGLLALKGLLTILKKGKLVYFSYYLFAVGAITVSYSIIRMYN